VITSPTNPTRFRAVGVAAGLAIVVCALTACATGTGTTAGGDATSKGSESQQYDKWVADNAACMEKAGFGEDADLGPGTPGNAAAAECEQQLGPAPMAKYDPNDPTQQAVDRAMTAAEHKCYGRLGYEVPKEESQTPDDITEADLNTCLTEGQEAGDKARDAAK
jgi:hypothetical protein